MKINWFAFTARTLCFFRLICLFVFFDNNITISMVTVSLFASNSILIVPFTGFPLICIIGLLILLLLLWILAIISTVIGVKSKTWRKISLITVMTIALFDAVFPLLYSATELKIACTVLSILIIGCGAKALYDLTKDNLKRDSFEEEQQNECI